MEIEVRVVVGDEVASVKALIEYIDFIEAPDYREYLFDATVDQMKQALKEKGVL
ncbi:hypothetical protein [Mycobacterium tuberculosis]|uniref:Uncharacterized protein n=4 Tax=Veracruzvirus heldan TaxID=1032892 RepID=A0A8F3ILY5_9CAUD|nr:hypothetical protein [Mycobacterium tuberculosis]YP_009637668.1 hypothetical protein FGG19_gp54 [Mycobacterium phage HelDan]ASW31301.1 hypothetical protein SEA_FRED313_43 [Mycobacterium phage Fred313]QDP44323.1 hypothetical protein SEA_HEATHEN_43 [Mycobacterium phage Heathen]QWY79584.1 hypothetical protein SEA_SCOUT_43 [Mycobacterium phage Scout]AEJ92072.1 hypothetical protein HELDAN_43 [Mycobacterium phage HelDan]MBP2972716.1 hypothetical protein [Mycobacterium tuberculosis]